MTPEEKEQCGSTTTGGYLKDIPEPHIRRWPDSPQKRRVRIGGGQYPGFPHYHLHIDEEDNPIYHTGRSEFQKHDTWCIAWDDKEGKGKTFHNVLPNRALAKAWVAKILRQHFPEDVYEVDDDVFKWDDDLTFVKKYEGD